MTAALKPTADECHSRDADNHDQGDEECVLHQRRPLFAVPPLSPEKPENCELKYSIGASFTRQQTAPAAEADPGRSRWIS